MTHRTNISIAALFAAAALSTPTLAQTLDVDLGADAGVSVGADEDELDVGVGADAEADVGVDTDSGSHGDDEDGVDAQADASTVLGASVNSNEDETSAAFDVAAISIIHLGDNTSGDVAGSVGGDVVIGQGDLDQVQADLETNVELTAFLEAEGIDLNDVIDIEISDDGSTDVFVAEGVVNAQCGDVNLSLMDAASAAEIAAADAAIVTSLSECGASDVTADLGGTHASEIALNDALVAELQAQGYNSADVLGVSAIGNATVNIFVESDRS